MAHATDYQSHLPSNHLAHSQESKEFTPEIKKESASLHAANIERAILFGPTDYQSRIVQHNARQEAKEICYNVVFNHISASPEWPIHTLQTYCMTHYKGCTKEVFAQCIKDYILNRRSF